MKPSTPAWAGLLAVLAGCGIDRSEGNSIETENVVTAREISLDTLMEPWSRPAGIPTVGTIRLDGDSVVFHGATSKGRGLSVEQMDGTPLPFELPYWDSVALRGRLHVRVVPGKDPGRIRLRWALGGASPLSDSVGTWSGIPEWWRTSLLSAPVDDFEDGNLFSRIAPASRWRAGAFNTATIDSPSVVLAGRGRSGSAVHVRYSARSPDYAVFALTLNRIPRSLRGMESLEFWARGSGTMFCALEHLTGSTGPKAWMHRTLTDTGWVRFRIHPQDFDQPDLNPWNFGWNAVRDSITDLTFVVEDGTDLWLDDIRFNGVDGKDFSP